ncbi:MAG: hypothetical protein KF819_21855 [Labilithrix sp.]|nr:hypothetical protein [Labilithrix sp.]
MLRIAERLLVGDSGSSTFVSPPPVELMLEGTAASLDRLEVVDAAKDAVRDGAARASVAATVRIAALGAEPIVELAIPRQLRALDLRLALRRPHEAVPVLPPLLVHVHEIAARERAPKIDRLIVTHFREMAHAAIPGRVEHEAPVDVPFQRVPVRRGEPRSAVLFVGRIERGQERSHLLA